MRKLYFLFFLAFLPLVASAQAVEIDGIYYNLNSSGDTKTAEVTQNSNKYSGDIVLPETITHNDVTYSVTSIGDVAFYQCIGLTSVTIPNSVTSIGESAFLGCSGLTSVTIPNSVISIGDHAFFDCSDLSSVTIGNSVTTIGDHAFQHCSYLTSLTIGNSVTSIGEMAFLDCSSLTSVTIPNSVVSIGGGAFSGCSGLSSLMIGNSVTSIGGTAFWGCNGLTSVTIPNSVTSIGSSAFQNCSGLTSLTIGNSVTSIDDFAFKNCSSLTSVTIPNSVTNIGYQTFSDCSGLTSVTIGNSVTSIRIYAFSDCSSLSSVIVQCSPSSIENDIFYECSSIKEVTFDCEAVTNMFSEKKSIEKVTMTEKVTSIGEKAFFGCSGLTSVTIPNGVATIGDRAFSGCSGLTSLTIGNSVISIDNGAFGDCSGLTSVTIPNNVTSIGEHAFQYCSGLTSLAIGNSVTSIGDYAFWGCSGLTSVTIPNSVTSIGDRAFSDCSDLTSVNVQCVPTSIGGWSPFYNCSNLKEVTFDCETVTKLFSGMKSIEKATMTEKVTSIVENAFWGCSGLTSVIVQCVPTSIGYYPFYECSNLKDVTFDCEMVTKLFSGIKSIEKATITEKVTSIGSSAFYGCSGLTFVTIPNSVTSIGEDAFYGCTGLTSFNIPNSVTSIGYSAFRDCSGLTSVTIPNSVGSIGNFVFADCSGLTSLTIGNSVTSIGDYAFQNCSGLASLTIPNSVISIGAGAFYNTAWYNNQPDGLVYAGKVAYLYKGKMPENTAITLESGTLGITRNAFSGCSGLTSVTIPTSVISIGLSPFGNCSKLTSVVVESDNPVYDSRDNCNAIIETSTNTLIAGCHNTKIPNSVAHIGNSAFWNCNGLKTLAIPEGVKSIGSSAFRYCYFLQTLELPSSLEAISPYAFGSCTRLTNVISHIQEPFSIQKNVFDISTMNTGVETIYPNSITLYVPESSIDAYKSTEGWATEGWSSFKNVLPLEDILANIEFADAKVKEICVANWDTNGDAELSRLEASMVPDLGDVFRYKYELRSFHELKYFTGLISISGFAFSGINDFSVTIPENVKDISFFDWHPRTVEVVENNPYLKFVDGVLYNNDLTILYYCTEDGDKQEFEIPNSVKRISSGAFYERKMASVAIPQSVTDIWAEAFWGCSSLTTIFIPNSVTYIGTGVFGGCKNLTSIIVEKDNPVYDSRDNCNAIIKTSDNTLIQGCSATVIPQDVTTIGDYAFWGINSLNHIEIPPSVLSIGSWGFAGTGLTSVTIPQTVTSIGDVAFATNLKSVIVEHKEPLTIDAHAFSDSNKSAVLYVPAGSKAAYESADVWKDFKEIIEIGETESIKISSAKQVTYMSDKDLDFAGYPDLKAYVATGYDKSSGTIWLTRVKEVPAMTGFLLMGAAGDYEIPVKKGESTSYYMNLFKGTIEGTTIQTTDGDNTNYYLSKGDAGVGFYKVQGSVTLKANRAYLSVPTEIPAVGAAGSTETIKVSSAGQLPYYNSQSLDFSNLDALGVKAYTATGYDYNSGTIWLTRVKQVPAKTGILIMAPEGEYPVPTASVSSVYANMFRGTLEGTTIQTHETIAGEDYINYYLSSGDAGVGFYKVTKEGGVSIGANRCYLPIKNKDAAAGTRSAGSGQSQIAFEEADEVIGIQLLRGIGGDDDGTSSIKDLTPALSEGEGEWYTLQGQRVAKPGKGLYIKNGKVVVIK